MDPILYERTVYIYNQMKHVFEHENVDAYRQDILHFQRLYLIYVMVYDHPIFGEFLNLLQKMTDNMI
jgi:hypothetical protein